MLGLSEAPGGPLKCDHGPLGAHPVLLLRLQLPHTLQEPGLGPVQIRSEACDGNDIRLQLRCWDVYVHLVEMEQTRYTWGPSGRERVPLAPADGELGSHD